MAVVGGDNLSQVSRTGRVFVTQLGGRKVRAASDQHTKWSTRQLREWTFRLDRIVARLDAMNLGILLALSSALAYVLTHPEDATPAEGVTFLDCDLAEAVRIGLAAGHGDPDVQVNVRYRPTTV